MTAPAVLTAAPLLTDLQAEEALRAVRAIAADLPAPDVAAPAGPSRGSSGFALFWTAYAEVTGDDAARATALAHVEAGIGAIAGLRGGLPGLFAAPVGLGWTLGVLEGRLLDVEPGSHDVDDLVVMMLRNERWPGSFDLIRGIVGFGVYGLSRLPRETAHETVELAITRLSERAMRDGDGLTWPAVTDFEFRKEEFPHGHVDVGIAHGMAGAVAFLANAYRAGYDAAEPLLTASLAWLRAQDSGRRDGTAYPGIVGIGGGPTPARLAWCYGDAATAAVLVQAGRALSRADVLEEARDVARGCALLRDTGIVDTGLCHGTAGAAHLFHRLGRALGDDELLGLARAWFAQTLAERRHGPGAGGFATFVNGNDRYEPWPSLLEGSAGVGLALLSALSSAAPWWDGLLLLDGCGPWR